MDDQNSENEQNSENKENNSRRNFLKFGAIGAAVAATAAAGVSIAKKMEGTPLDHFPLPVNDDYVRIDQRNQINTYSFSKKLNDEHPERTKAFHNWDSSKISN